MQVPRLATQLGKADKANALRGTWGHGPTAFCELSVPFCETRERWDSKGGVESVMLWGPFLPLPELFLLFLSTAGFQVGV